jgi:hypothetical protein
MPPADIQEKLLKVKLNKRSLVATMNQSDLTSRHKLRFFDSVGGYNSDLEFSLPDMDIYEMDLQTLISFFTFDAGDNRPIKHYFYTAASRTSAIGSGRPLVSRSGDYSASGLRGDLFGLVRRSQKGITISWVIKLGVTESSDVDRAIGLINAVKVRFHSEWINDSDGPAISLSYVDILGGDSIPSGIGKLQILRNAKINAVTLGGVDVYIKRPVAMSCLLLWNYRSNENAHLQASEPDAPLVIHFSQDKTQTAAQEKVPESGDKRKLEVSTSPATKIYAGRKSVRAKEPAAIHQAAEPVALGKTMPQVTVSRVVVQTSPCRVKVGAKDQLNVPAAIAPKVEANEARAAITSPLTAADMYNMSDIVSKADGRANEAAHNHVIMGIQLYSYLLDPTAGVDVPIAAHNANVIMLPAPSVEHLLSSIDASSHNRFFDMITLLVRQAHADLETVGDLFTWVDLKRKVVSMLQKGLKERGGSTDEGGGGGGSGGGGGGSDGGGGSSGKPGSGGGGRQQQR